MALAKFEQESGRAAQIVARDSQTMANATAKADAAVRRYAAGFGRVGIEAKAISAAVAGASDEALKLFAGIDAGATAFARVGAAGASAFKGIGASADASLQLAENRILLIAEKARQVRDQAEQLKTKAVAENTAGTLDDPGLKQRLANIRAVEKAELERIATVARADADARRAAQAERGASSKALATAQVGSGAATAEAQTRVFLAFATAQAAAAEAQAAAQARVAQAQAAATAASERGQAAQRSAYETKVAYIAKVNEEAQALFRTRDAQRELDAVRAGVSPAEAAKLAKFAGDRDFLASVRQQIAAEQKLADEFGKTKAEIAAQSAEQRGLTNTAAAAIERLNALEKANKAAADAETQRKAGKSFIASLNERALGINDDGTQKSQSAFLAEKAAILGVSKEAEAAIAKIAALDARTGQLGKSAFASRNQLLTLQYTIGDVIASAGSGASPLTILLQQGGQIFDAFGGASARENGGFFKNFIGALGTVLTPARIAVGGVTAAVGALAYAMYQGAEQSKAFADAVVLSGNFAGQTEGQFNRLVSTIAQGGQVTASMAREVGQALLATGEIGPAVFGKATAVAALYGQATGKTAKEVADNFASMSRDATKWATENNRSMNLVTAAQLEVIKGLQESGRATEAQGLVLEALGKRLGGLEENLGNIDRLLRTGRSLWDQWWNAALANGRKETVEDKLAAVEARITAFREKQTSAAKPGEGFNASTFGGVPLTQNNYEADLVKRDNLQRDQQQQKNAAFLAATAAATTKAATAGRANVEALLASTKSSEQYSKALRQLNADIEANARAGTPFTAQQEADARAELKKRFTDKGSRGAGKDAEQERKAQLDKDLQVFAAALARERDALKFSQDEQRAIYDAGNTSLAAYYDQRQAIIRQGTQAELNEQAQAIGRIADELKRGDLKKDERIRLERQLADAQAKAADIQRGADSAATLATYERAAAVKALTREVENFQASLADLQGDPLGAAQLRAAQQVDAARQLAARAAPAGGAGGDFARFDRGQPAVDVEGYARAITLANEYAEVQRRVGVATADAGRAEEAYLLRAQQSGAGLREQDQAVYTLRSAALVQLGELTEAAKRLAEASTDPRVKAFAADLALQYAKAADAVDPALNRLRENISSLASSISSSLTSSIADAGSSFFDRRASNAQDVRKAKDEYTQRLDALEGYLANARTAEDKARLRRRIAEVQDQKERLQRESKFATALKVIERDILGPVVKQVTGSITKTIIGDPLEQFLKGGLNNAIQSDNPLANLLRGTVGVNAVGAGADTAAKAAAAAATTAQTLAAQTSTAGLVQLSVAANAAAAALAAIGGQSAVSGLAGAIPGISFSTATVDSGFGNGAAFGNFLSAVFHDGGIVGGHSARRAVSAGVFDGAQRYHGGGVIKSAAAPALGTNEVPAILMGGPRGTREEVLTATDPRHRDNMGAALLRMLAAGGAARGSAAGYTRPAVRYHTGGIAGLSPDGVASLMRGGSAPARDGGRGAGGRSGVTNITINMPPGTSRETADQLASRMAQKLGASSRRNN